MELVDFLRARLDEDEAVARRACEYAEASWKLDEEFGETVLWWAPEPHIAEMERQKGLTVVSDQWRGQTIDQRIAPHVARHDPARVLAEVEAKRAIVDLMAGVLAAAKGDSEVDHYGGLSAAEETLTLFARPFRDHPDFDPAWLED